MIAAPIGADLMLVAVIARSSGRGAFGHSPQNAPGKLSAWSRRPARAARGSRIRRLERPVFLQVRGLVSANKQAARPTVHQPMRKPGSSPIAKPPVRPAEPASQAVDMRRLGIKSARCITM